MPLHHVSRGDQLYNNFSKILHWKLQKRHESRSPQIVVGIFFATLLILNQLYLPHPESDEVKGFPDAVHCWQREPKEPHFSIGREAVGHVDQNTTTTIHHQVASARMGSPRQPTMSPSLQHQALHGWGIMWHFSFWCFWCTIRSTILVEATCNVWVATSCCYCYFGK